LGEEIDPGQVLRFLAENAPGEEIDQWPAAACAVEIALMDLAGQTLSQPLSAMLDGRINDNLTYSAVVTISEPDKLEGIIDLIRAARATEVKVKVGHDGDLDLVGMVRRAFGPEVDLRVDANGGWSSDEAIEKIQALQEFGISAVEQPVAKNDLNGLIRVNRQVKPLVIADESLCTLSDAYTLIQAEAVGGFNLRLSKCGGPARTLKLLALAREAGIVCQLGCQVGELGLLSAAGRHFAATQPDLIHLEGSLTRFFLPEDIIVEDLTPGPGGIAAPLPEPGLGVTVLDSALAESLLFTLP
ncbi:MAG: enolase, partial [Deltaproteobacteria bacterium]|nr:enolase [Deltaproteobacteria bacterium]